MKACIYIQAMIRLIGNIEGYVFTKVDEKEYWAPAVIEIDNKYYMYVSTMPINESDTHHKEY